MPKHPEDLAQLESYVPPAGNGNGSGATTVVVGPWDDDADIDFGDDVMEDDGMQVNDDVLQLQASNERLTEAMRQQEAARLQPKVTAGALGAAIAGGIPAILSAVDAEPAAGAPAVRAGGRGGARLAVRRLHQARPDSGRLGPT